MLNLFELHGGLVLMKHGRTQTHNYLKLFVLIFISFIVDRCPSKALFFCMHQLVGLCTLGP